MLQSILYGNGINRLTEGMPSWDVLIKELSDVDLDSNIPNPLKYEVLLMKKPYREPDQRLATRDGLPLVTGEGKILFASGELTERVLKEKISRRLNSFGSNEIYDAISNLPVSNFLTTNYDNTLFISLGEGSLDKRFREEKIYSIRRNYVINTNRGREQHYWPIHGNVDSPASIMLGFDHYCGSLAKIEAYVKGGYDLHDRKLDSLIKRLNIGIEDAISWIDLFFISDVHIIGLNLGYEETDLWWVFNRRRRIKQAYPNLINNHLFYYPVESLKTDVQQLLLSFDINVVSLDEKVLKDPLYVNRYREQMVNIHSNMLKGIV